MEAAIESAPPHPLLLLGGSMDDIYAFLHTATAVRVLKGASCGTSHVLCSLKAPVQMREEEDLPLLTRLQDPLFRRVCLRLICRGYTVSVRPCAAPFESPGEAFQIRRFELVVSRSRPRPS